MSDSHINSIEQMTENPFLNLYRLGYTDRLGSERNYYFCSRNSADSLKAVTHDITSEGVSVYAVTEEEEPRLLVIKEYRLPLDAEIYTLPAGLIDPGESPGEAAVREVREECGCKFKEYTGGAPFMRRPFFLAPGFSDEPGSAVFGTVSNLDAKPDAESTEWIQRIYASKDEVRRILSEERISVRAAFLMMQFLRSDNKDPFGFLDI